jgi:hypothetical protein
MQVSKAQLPNLTLLTLKLTNKIPFVLFVRKTKNRQLKIHQNAVILSARVAPLKILRIQSRHLYIELAKEFLKSSKLIVQN